MKVLALSLMRLGDLLMHLGPLKSYQEQTGHEVHLLTNRECRPLLDLVPWIKKVYIFDRNLVQRSISEPYLSVNAGYSHIAGLVSEINAQDYLTIFNLTNNFLSSRLMDLLKARDKRGAQYHDGRAAATEGAWETLLNDLGQQGERSLFHQRDLIKGILGSQRTVKFLMETSGGIDEAFDFLEDAPFIAIQPLTSDDKKNWGLERFFNLVLMLRDSLPQHRILILCSPQELSLINETFADALPSNAKIACTSIAGAYSLLKRAALLVSGDTLIKHLAAEAGTPVLEINIGSSKYYETGVYSSGSYMLVSRELCMPCEHSQSCFRDRKYCADRISSVDVHEVLVAMIKQDATRILNRAFMRSRHFSIYRTDFDLFGQWFAESLQPQPLENLYSFCDRVQYLTKFEAAATSQVYAQAGKYFFDRFIVSHFENMRLVENELGRLQDLLKLIAHAERQEAALLLQELPQRILNFTNQASHFPLPRLKLEALREMSEQVDLPYAQKQFLNWLNAAMRVSQERIKFLNAIISQGGLYEKGSGTTP